MLAPCFKTAAELGLSAEQRDALVNVLGQLERGELHEIEVDEAGQYNRGDPKGFSMRCWGTCLCGHANRLADFDSAARSQGGPTGKLFYHTHMDMAQATVALRDYLVSGR
jgi:hypothetical protein